MMQNKNLWDQFVRTGKIDDYLNYVSTDLMDKQEALKHKWNEEYSEETSSIVDDKSI